MKEIQYLTLFFIKKNIDFLLDSNPKSDIHPEIYQNLNKLNESLDHIFKKKEAQICITKSVK